MRATGIRYKDKTKPTDYFLDILCDAIVSATGKRGFITESYKLTGSAIKIGLHMSSFRINTAKLGHNARIGRYIKSPKGYKRTNIPTWDQRVEFNDIVNDVFDRYGLVANIKSGAFTVRNKREGRMDETDWRYQGGGHHFMSYASQAEILTEKEAREYCDSDRLEREHREATADIRRERAREYRRKMRLFSQSKYVTLAGFWTWPKKDPRNGRRVTHKQFARLLGSLSEYARRRVRLASVAATCSLAEVSV